MSGDSKRNEEPDFLDDDFVVEDLAGKNDDLEQLFTDPGAAKAPAAKADAAPDSDDVLFTDHSKDTVASEQFAGGAAFAEDGKSTWQGEKLELGGDEPKKRDGERLAEAEAAFTEELGSMLQNDEELPLDSEKELELVDQPSADEVKEFEQSGAFTLEEGDRAWQEQNASRARQPRVEPEVAKGIWEAVKDPAMAEHADEEAVEATQEPGWEQLPETSVDQLSEVDGVDEAVEEPPPDESELAAVDGHDIYGDDAPELVGARAGSRRRFGMMFAMAASLALVGGAAVLVMRPEWVGLRLEGERVQQVIVERPRIEVAALTTPAVPEAPRVAAADPTAPRDPSDPHAFPTKDPIAMSPDPQPGVPFGPEPPPIDPSQAPTQAAVPQAIPGVVAAADPASPVGNWPVPVPAPGPKPLAPGANTRNGKSNRLVRISDNTMLGGEGEPTAHGRAVDGMLPGTRAFAQLHNGNYFIGSIKNADADKVTLRLVEGEVTLASTDILRITALGSADYEALQRATSGFVRLTNNNRLVGAILSQIADDHIVLEFRSNRVILPKSVVGAVVEGEQDAAVRLDMTPQENDWVHNFAERQLGTQTPGPAAPSPKGASTPIEPAKVGAAGTQLPSPAPAPAPKRTPAAPPQQR